jgi:hypothetical protein
VSDACDFEVRCGEVDLQRGLGEVLTLVLRVTRWGIRAALSR